MSVERCVAVAPNGYSRCELPAGHDGDHDCNEAPGRHSKWADAKPFTVDEGAAIMRAWCAYIGVDELTTVIVPPDFTASFRAGMMYERGRPRTIEEVGRADKAIESLLDKRHGVADTAEMALAALEASSLAAAIDELDHGPGGPGDVR